MWHTCPRTRTKTCATILTKWVLHNIYRQKKLQVRIGQNNLKITILTTHHNIFLSLETLSHSLGTSVTDEEMKLDGQPITVGSASAVHDRTSTSPHHQHVKRALINPFSSSSQLVRLTSSSRRRWTHTFPQGLLDVYLAVSCHTARFLAKHYTWMKPINWFFLNESQLTTYRVANCNVIREFSRSE